MASNRYEFTTHWRVEATLQEVADILGDAAGLVRWWPSVYLDVQVLEPGEPSGVGRVVRLYTKGWLPYTLRWDFRVTDVRPDGFSLKAFGDFNGTGDWTFKQHGQYVDITYDWRIDAEKPLLKTFSFIMKPIFSKNHEWAMRMGEQSLTLELARRHAHTAAERAAIPAPPPATPMSPLRLLWDILKPSRPS